MESYKGVNVGSKKYVFAVKTDKNSFYHKPEMMGHKWASEYIDMLDEIVNQFGSSELQKLIIRNVIDFSEKEWSYFGSGASIFTKRFIANFKMVLKNIDKQKDNIYSILNKVQNRSGMLKTRLNWILEYLSYRDDKENYTRSYVASCGFYGMPRNEAVERLDKYINGLKSKLILS